VAELWPLAAVFGVGVAASFIGSIVGGGSLLSIPLLIFLGLPPQVAIATDRFAALGGAATALYRFSISDRIVWRFVPILAVTSLVGSLIGARLLVDSETESLRFVVGILLIALVPFLFLKPDIGVSRRQVTRRTLAIGLSLYFIVQVLAGFFGGGTGTMIFFILMACFGVTIVEVAATQIVPFIVLAVSSSIVFAAAELIDYPLGFVLMAGTAVGGYLGAHIAVRKGEQWVRRIFVVVVLVSASQLLLR
jgi:uncharacterized membrane protein YfcA